MNGEVSSHRAHDWLYKYRPFTARSLSILLNRELYFAKPSALNDPYDCQPSFMQGFRVAKDLVERGELKLEDGSWLWMMLAFGYERMAKKMQDQFRNCGVLSLSAADTLECSLMWAHYADNHRGFSLGFQLSSRFTAVATQEKQTDIIYCNPVRYDESQPIIDYIKRKDGHKGLESSAELVKASLASKSNAWRYEQEHRIVRRQPGVVKFGPEELCEVVFGSWINDADKDEIRSLLRSREWSHVRYRRVKVGEDGTYRLHLVDC